MVQSKAYSMEQIDVPANFETILKTYAKAVIKTQPYDLIRWSAMYFRCLATDKVPPVKDRLETNCEHGRLTPGYLKVLLRQIGKGFHVTQDTLQDYWKGLCLLEEDLLKFMSLSRMLYWNKIHWLKLFAVMVGSLNNNLKDTAIMLCELLTDSPEGSSSPIPLWMFKECFTFLAQLDCSREQTFIDSRLVLNNGDLDVETNEPSCPILSPSVATIIGQMAMCRSKGTIAELDDDALNQLQHQADNFEDMLRDSGDFGNLISLLAQVVQSGEIDSVVSLMSVDKRAMIEKSMGESAEVHRANGNEKVAHLYADKEKNVREIGTLWSWVYQFVQCTSDDSGNNKSFNFISSTTDLVAFNENSTQSPQPPEVESPLATEIDATLTDDGGDLLPDHPPTGDANEKAPIDMPPPPNIHDDVIDIGAFLREAETKGLFQATNTPSAITFLSDASHAVDPQLGALKDYLEQCTDTFHDINELLRGYTEYQNNYQAGGEMVEKIITQAAQMATMTREDSSIDDKANTSDEEKMTQDDPNIINVFAKSGIEADEDLIRAAIAEQMILGLIEKTIRDSEDTLRAIEGKQDAVDAPHDGESNENEGSGSANQESRDNSTETENKMHVSVESHVENNDRQKVENDSNTQDVRESKAGSKETPTQTTSVGAEGSNTNGENSSEKKDAPQEMESNDTNAEDEAVKQEDQVDSPENDSIKMVNGEKNGVNKSESSDDAGIQAVDVESEAKNDHKVEVLDSSGVSIDVEPEPPHALNADSKAGEEVATVVNGNDFVTDSNSLPLVSKSVSKDDEGEKVDDKSSEVIEPVESKLGDCEKPSSAGHTSYSCTIGPMLGIGAAVSPGTLTALMDYLTERAKEQNGMIYPRNFDEEQCPPLYDDVK